MDPCASTIILGILTIVSEGLAHTPDGYPKSITQCIFYFCKSKKIEPEPDIELKDIKIIS